MPYFIVIGRDGIDPQAQERRMAARAAHIEAVTAGIDTGQYIMGAAMLNSHGQMCGSVMTLQFENRSMLDEWLKTEPYVTGDVWKEIEIIECLIPPKFLEK